MRRDADVLIVGGGAMGMAAASVLTGRGVDTVLLERFSIGHLRGSSGGPTRIFRLAYPEERYGRMAELALEAWRALEEVSNEQLLVTTGGIDIGERAHMAADALAGIGRSFQWMDPAQAGERWPGVRFHDSEEILFQPDAGVCYAERTVRTLVRLATERGARIQEETPVQTLVQDADGVLAVTEDGDEVRAPVAIVTAGSWAGPLLAGVGIELALSPTVEQVSYFRLEEPSALPTLIDWTNVVPASEGFQRRGPYAVPDPERPGDVKLGLHVSGPRVDASDGPFEVDQARIKEVKRWAAARFAPLLETEPSHTCLYTRTPDHNFVIDRVGPVVIGSPCSGHGFKFTPLIGEILADLATGATPPVNLDAFSASRTAVRLS